MNEILATGSSFLFASLNRAKFQSAHLENVDFKGAYVANADFYRAKLTNSTITAAQLQEALAYEESIGSNFNISGHKNMIRNGYAEVHTEQSLCSTDLRRPFFASIWDRIDSE